MKKKPSVTAVVNLYKRGHLLEAQLEAIKSQSHKVDEILVWENGADEFHGANRFPLVRARSSHNLGVWARFAFALNAKSEFVWFLDDDSIPGSRFLENCLRTFEISPGVIGSRGLVFRTRTSYGLYDEFGPLNPNEKAQEVDIVGHNWVLPRSWLGAFWGELENAFPSPFAGEDIHVSYSVQKCLGLPTIVPPHPVDNLQMWGDTRVEDNLGSDSVAISKSAESLVRFEQALAHYRGLGFITLVERSGKAKSFEDVQGYAIARFPNLVHRIARLMGIKKKPRPVAGEATQK